MHEQDTQQLQLAYTHDGNLVRQSLAGNHAAFETLVHIYDAQLLAYIRRLLNRNGNAELAHDVLQHVLLQFYSSLPTLSANCSLKPWLFRVAHNRCMDELRAIQRRPFLQFSELREEVNEDDYSFITSIQDTHPLPEEVAEQHEFQQEFYQALQMLPSRYRSIVLLRCVYEMTFREIGLTLKMPERTAKTYFHRARPLLHAALTLS